MQIFADTEMIARLQPALERQNLKEHGKTQDMVALLTERLGTMEAAQKAQEAGISLKVLQMLVAPIAGDVTDAQSALIELTRAVEIAVKVQREGAVGANHGEFVDEVLQRVAELSRESDYSGAGAEINAALAREEAESAARKLRLIASGIETATLERNPDRIATLLLCRADLEAGGTATLPKLRALQDEWYERGRDKGLNLDLEVSIVLASKMRERATNAAERGAMLNDLGLAL
ncbi:hypothetical protein [Palleronia caenipelagi]|uniref:Uncharacterized protein n=1 Tax=Palleronia caenipelagi TaxID=2489174 RepID=A0A547Q893_9RHOB|nr:hypothetical protein [Palleronia caenipelagi]TRD22602.1 hypothetical protein FEV53_04085 [Palleronia caenipelagi]